MYIFDYLIYTEIKKQCLLIKYQLKTGARLKSFKVEVLGKDYDFVPYKVLPDKILIKYSSKQIFGRMAYPKDIEIYI